MNQSNEAPASVTYSITSKDGFNILFTVRDDKASELLDKMAIIEPSLIKRGYVPQIKKSFGGGGEKKPEVIIGKCPECGGDLLEKTTLSGKKFQECRNRKYDFATKKDVGSCKYIKWLD